MKPFLVLGLPRSRTFWLSVFLSRLDRVAQHDYSRRFKSRHEIKRYFARENVAVVDTALGLIWHELAIPDVRTAIVHRPVEEVRQSLQALGLPTDGLEAHEAKLWKIEGMHFKHTDLDTRDGADAVYEYCHGFPAPIDRWQRLIKHNLQCDPAAYKRDALLNHDGITAVFGPQMDREAA